MSTYQHHIYEFKKRVFETSDEIYNRDTRPFAKIPYAITNEHDIKASNTFYIMYTQPKADIQDIARRLLLFPLPGEKTIVGFGSHHQHLPIKNTSRGIYCSMNRGAFTIIDPSCTDFS